MQRRGFLGLLVGAIAAPFVPRRDVSHITTRVYVRGAAANDAVFLESRRWQREDIARAFHVPVHMIGDYPHYLITPQGLSR